MLPNHTCYFDIPQEEFNRIKRYRSRDITTNRFRDPTTWRELSDIMVYHPNPITRHEACFVAAELQIPYAHRLVAVVKFDQSIVNKHEAAEALGKLRDRTDAWMAYVFLRKTQKLRGYDDGVYHPDVQATVQESLDELEERFPDFKK